MQLTQKEFKIWCEKFGYRFERIKNEEIIKFRCSKSDFSFESEDIYKTYLEAYNHMTDYKWVAHQNEYKEKAVKHE